MFKDAISLIIAIISVAYILFANPVQAASPAVVPEGIVLASQEANKPYSNIEIVSATTTRKKAHNSDAPQWCLLPASEIQRLLTIYVSE